MDDGTSVAQIKNQMEYVINGLKGADETTVKNKFKTLLDNQAEDLYNSLPNASEIFGEPNATLFRTNVIDNINNEIFNFIKILE